MFSNSPNVQLTTALLRVRNYLQLRFPSAEKIRWWTQAIACSQGFEGRASEPAERLRERGDLVTFGGHPELPTAAVHASRAGFSRRGFVPGQRGNSCCPRWLKVSCGGVEDIARPQTFAPRRPIEPADCIYFLC